MIATALIGVDVERGSVVFGSAGAITVTAHRPRPAPPGNPGGHRLTPVGRFVKVNDLLDLTARQVAADLRAAPAAARRRFSMDARAERCRTIEDLRVLAKRTIPQPVFDYVDGAANDEVTYRRNRAGFEAVELQPRALVDVSDIELTTTVLGREIALPILAPPTGLTGLIHPDGEVAIAKAAHRAGSLYTLSTLSSRSIEEVHAEAPGPQVVPALRAQGPRARLRHARPSAGQRLRDADADGRRRRRRRPRARRAQPLLGAAAPDR